MEYNIPKKKKIQVPAMYYSCIEECPYFLEMHTEVVRGEES